MRKNLSFLTVPENVRASWRTGALFICLALVLLSAITTLILATGVTHQVIDIQRNYELRQQVDRVSRLAFDIENSRRGYLLTLENSYLDLYRSSILSVDEEVSKLVKMTEGNQLQQVRVREILSLIAREQEDVRQTVELAKAGNIGEAVAKVRGDEGKVLMDQLAKTVTLFINEEDEQLSQRNSSIHHTRYWLTLTSLLALASAVVMCWLMFSRFQRYVQQLSEGQSVLRTENVVLEQRVRERTIELQHQREIAERERERVEVLLQDSNHRIGNSLATVSSLLGLQLRQVTSDEARAALQAARDRVLNISTAHRRLRLGEDLETARIDEFLHAVIQDLTSSVSPDRKIEFITDFEPISLPARDVTTIGIILGELVTNALKHAFGTREQGRVKVTLHPDAAGVLVLSVEDNGNGLGEKRPLDRPGLGMLVVEQLCLQFGEKPHYGESENGGTRVEVHLSSLEIGLAEER